MTSEAEIGGRRGSRWRMAGWGAAVLILLAPFVAMQLTSEVDWDETDFIVIGVLLGSVGLSIEFLVRQSGSLAYRIGAVLAAFTAFLTLWSNLAVGMIGSEDNPYNLLFGGVLILALSGAIVARFEPAGMARTMLVTGIAQAAAGAFGLPEDMRGGIFSMAFAVPWLLAAALFRNAAREQRSAGAAR